MDATGFAWSVGASLAAAALYAFIPWIARALVRLRVSALTPGRDAERMYEEWMAAVWELSSRRRQLLFAATLFRDFQKLQTEIEFRVDEQSDLENLVEQRVQEKVDQLQLTLKAREDSQRAEFEQFRQLMEKDWADKLENMSLEELEKMLVSRAMHKYGNNVSLVAKALGLSRSAVYRRLQRYGL
jgi:DNA-binding NtrC family response regulator